MVMLTRAEIDKLSLPERLSLIGDLWDSVADDDLTLAPAQRAELDRRLATFERDRQQATSWESLKAELADRTGR